MSGTFITPITSNLSVGTKIIDKLTRVTNTGEVDFIIPDLALLNTTLIGKTENKLIFKSGFNSFIFAAILDSNGKIYCGGLFTLYSETAANRIIRLNPNGTVDTGFVYGTGFNVSVDAIYEDSNGKIYVGGNFTLYNGISANRIIRLNPDGTVDTGFVSGSGFNSTVRSIYEDSNGKIYVVGTFLVYNGTAANRIIRLNPNGTVDTGFVYGTGFNLQTNRIKEDINGKIYVFGEFTTYDGTAANRIIRLNPDGTVDTGFVYGTGISNAILSAMLSSDGKIYCVGSFTLYNGTAANRIIRLNPDGTVDTGFVYGSGFNGGSQYPGGSLLEDSNGKIYVGGTFTVYNGTAANRIIRLNPDGTVDTGFVSGNPNPSSSVLEILEDINGKIYIAGLFSTY